MESSTARKNTNFNKDVEIYGPIGEQWLLNKLKESPKTWGVENVSGNEIYQKADIDIIQYTNNAQNLDINVEEMHKQISNGKMLDEKFAIAYEVKSDTQIAKTRNIAYEVMSHTNPGCAARTLANYIVYTGIDDSTKQVTEAYLIPTKKLRYYVLTNFSLINKQGEMRSFYMNHGEDKTAILLINIDKLVKEKIAIKIF